MPKKSLEPGTRFHLSDLDLKAKIDEQDYRARRKAALDQLVQIQLATRHADRRALIVFEGWDAAGKGGTIRHLTSVLDPRAFAVWPIAAPSAEDQGKHYLYRFWTKLPARKTIAIFDRSWYGRVLVERVDGFATPSEWQRAYDEINAFEKMLTDDGAPIIKIFLHISAGEQLNRFQARLENPVKRWKLTEDDLRNRAKRADYEKAVEDMFFYTSPAHAPWHVIASEQKALGRVQALEAIADRLSQGLDLTPPPASEKVVRAIEKERAAAKAHRSSTGKKKKPAT